MFPMNFIPAALAATSAAEEEGGSLIPTIFGKVILAIGIIALTVLVGIILKKWVRRIIRKKQGDRHQEVAILYGRIIFVVTLLVGFFVALTTIGAPLEWFSGGIGLGLAFSLRDILTNFFSGLILLTNNKFNIGDYVTLDENTSGTIVDIQSRATSLRAMDGGEITIPNMKMLASNVKCYTKNPIRRHVVLIGVGYGSDLKAASELIQNTLKANKNVEPEPEPIVLVSEVVDSAVMLQARFWTESSAQWWIIKSEITREIFDALSAAGIDIPHPIRTLRVDENSSGLLAEQPHLLEKLQKIETAKSDSLDPKTVFHSMPNEATVSPASARQ